MEAVFLGISKKPKWVCDADISKSFDRINHQYLLDKCQTFPKMRKQLKAWLKAGILEGEEYALPEMRRPQGGNISPLLANIALHGLRSELDNYINTLPGHKVNNRQSLTFVRYADDFVLMHPSLETLYQLKGITEKFLKPIGLKLHPTKTKIVHTYEATFDTPPGFTFLGFDIIQKRVWNKMREATKNRKSTQEFITLIKPSKTSIAKQKQKIRDTTRRYRGVSQEILILKLNPIIRGWALSKRTQISNKTFQALDQYVFIHLWNWARKRHPKMSKYQLKYKYWHKIEKSNWVFGVQTETKEVKLKLQLHSKISIQRHVKIKGKASPFDGNLLYWATRTGKNPLIASINARLIQEQKGLCGICKNPFLPDDPIERDHIVPKPLEGINL